MTAGLDQYLDGLRTLPFVREVAVHELPAAQADSGADAVIEIKAPDRAQRFLAVEKRGRLGYPIVNDLIARFRLGKLPLLLLTPHIPAPLAEYLVANGVCFVDTAGNCHVRIGGNYVALMQGKRPPTALRAARETRAPGFQVLFALLADPTLVERPVREIAAAAGAGKTAVADLLGQLAHEGALVVHKTGRRLVDHNDLRERWLAGYGEILRPRWLRGRFHPPETTPEALEQQLARMLRDRPWALGGTAAAVHLVPGYRGTDTVLHVPHVDPTLLRTLRAVPDDRGTLVVFETPCPIAFTGPLPHVVHPLLVYAELVAGRDLRAQDTARDLRARLLEAPE